MSNKLITWVAILAIVLVGGLMLLGLSNKTVSTSGPEGVTIIDGASSDDPTVDHFFKVDGILTVAANAYANLLGTTTIAHSPDGFVLWDDFTVGTTTSVVRGVITNTSGPLMCDGASGFVYSNDPTGAFAPSFKLVLGVSATAGYSASLIASTTIATSTPTVTAVTSPVPFILASGSSITVSVGDYSAPIASSTHQGNWAGQFGIHCWNLGS